MKRFQTAGWALVLLLCGCFSREADDALRVAVFTSDPSILKILNGVVEDIEARHPGLDVRLVNIPYGNFQDKITTLIAAGDPPDVISIEANNFVDLHVRGAFEDLTPFVERDRLDMDAFYPAIRRRYSPGGRVYGIPADIAPFGLVYYNQRLFREAGLPFPTREWSWPTDFLAVCRKLTKKDEAGKTVQWAYADPYNIQADGFLLSNGGYYVDDEENPTRLTLDSPRALEAFRFRWDLIHTFGVSPTPSQIQAFNFGPGAETLFANGRVAMMASGIWHTPALLEHKDLEFDVVEFPRGPHGDRGWGSGGTAYAIARGSRRKEDAWKVVRELTSAETLAKVASTGMIQPARRAVAASPAFLESPGPPSKRILLSMPRHARFGPFLPAWNEIWFGQVGPALDRAWTGAEPPEEILRRIVPELNRKYFGEGKRP